MKTKFFFIMFLAIGIMLPGANLWADDDAIMDVDDNAASFVGSWGTSSVRILYYGDDYAFAAGSGGGATTASATFTTAQTADITGQYHVYVRWTAGNMRATSAVYRIRDNLGNSLGSCTKDQRFNGGAWQFCDNVTLTAGRRGVVVLGNENEPTNRFVCADAVRFVRQAWDNNDIVDEPGYELAQRGSTTSLALCSLPSANWTTLGTITLTTPRNYGIVWVHADGISLHTNDEWARVCIAANSGCTSLAPVLDQSSREVAEGAWDNETRWTFFFQAEDGIRSVRT